MKKFRKVRVEEKFLNFRKNITKIFIAGNNGITRRTLETTGHWGLNPTELNQKYEPDVKIFKRSWVVFMYRKV